MQGTKTKQERKEEKERERREKKERRRERKEKKLRKLQLQKNVSSSTEESPKVGVVFVIFELSKNDRIFLVDKKYLMITECVPSTHVSCSVSSSLSSLHLVESESSYYLIVCCNNSVFYISKYCQSVKIYRC